MEHKEAVIFKQFDSTKIDTESKVCIHAAVADCDEEGPTPPPPRQSVEVRALVLF